MSLTLIIAIIIVGLFFIFVEVFFIPGISFVSIIGGIITGIGIYLGYNQYGQATGNWLLLAGVMGTCILLYIGYKRIQSNKWSLNTSSEGKVNNADISYYKTGAVGKAVTNLRPEGIAVFENDERITVFSIGEFIDKNTQIEILKIDHNKIFVKPVK